MNIILGAAEGQARAHGEAGALSRLMPVILTVGALFLTACAPQSKEPKLTVLEDDIGVFRDCAAESGKKPSLRPTPQRPRVRSRGTTKKTKTEAPCRAEMEQRLRAISVKKDIHIVLRTQSAPGLPQIALAAYFDKLFNDDPAWQKAPPRHGVARYLHSIGIGGNSPGNAVEFILLTKPAFVTMRMGSVTRGAALSYGLLSSSKLSDVQTLGTNDPIKGMVKLLDLFDASLPDKGKESWQLRAWRFLFFDDVSKFVDSITLNNWSFYNSYLLKPSLQLQFTLSKYVWFWSAPLFGIALFLVLAKLAMMIVKSLTASLGIPWLAIILSIAIELAAVLPSIGSLLLIARQRLEDRLFVEALLQTDLTRLMPLLERQSLKFDGQTGFLWAIPFALVGVISTIRDALMLEMALDDGPGTVADVSRDELIKSPFRYFFLYAYLPFAVSLIWTKKLLVDILMDSYKFWKKARS